MAVALGSGVARLVRWLAFGVWALLTVCVVLLAAAWWWTGTEGSLATALYVTERYAPQFTKNLTVQNPSGSMRAGGHVDRLIWRQDGLTVDVVDARVSWQPWALASGTVRLTNVVAASVNIDDQRIKTTASAPPASLRLPVQVMLGAFSVEQVNIAGNTAFSASGIQGRYSFDNQQHHLQLTSLNIASGKYSGRVRLEADQPFALSAMLSGAVSAPIADSSTSIALTFNASASGTLTDVLAQASLQISAASSASSKTTATQPNASVNARITPWETQPLVQASAVFRQLDAAALWPGAPQTQLTGSASVAPIRSTADATSTLETAAWELQLEAVNRLPGAWDKQRLPIQQLSTSAEWRDGLPIVKSLNAQLGGGSLIASGQATGTQTFSFQAALKNINPQNLHSQLAALPVNGQAKGSWSATSGGTLDLPTFQLRSRDVQVSGSLQLQPALLAGKANLRVAAPGLDATLQGDLRKTSGKGDARVQVQNAALALNWLKQLPGMPATLKASAITGNADITASWQGGWQDPAVQARLTAPALDVTQASTAPQNSTPSIMKFREVEAALTGRLRQASITASGRLEDGQRRYAVQAAADAGKSTTSWQGVLKQLALRLDDPALARGTWQLATTAPLALKYLPASKLFESGAGQAQLTAPAPGPPALIAWQAARWQAGQFSTAGKISGLPMTWVELFTRQPLASTGLTGNLVFDGQWNAQLVDTLTLKASLRRTSGDITVQPDTAQTSTTQRSTVRIAAGVREASVSLDSIGDAVTVAVRWDSERAGSIDGQLKTRLSKTPDSGWQWPQNAALSGQLKAQLPRVGVWSALAPPGWRLRGSLGADVAISGTRAAPQLIGELQANDLALRSVVDGIEFGNGRLRATLDGSRVRITEFTLQGAGDKNTGGTLSAQGVASWANGQADVSLDTRIDRLRASLRSDRQVTVSGNLSARLQNNQTQLTGQLKIDKALFVLPEDTAPQLGNDVVVRGAAPRDAVATANKAPDTPQPKPGNSRSLQLGIELDLGEDLRVTGKGLDTLVRGKLALSGNSFSQPRLAGTVNTVSGTYRAYGQQLDVERGALRFTGAPDNPALDILAIRPNLAQAGQRVGVQILGTALLPRVSLYAQPDLPDAEKLSWLVLGRSSASGGGEAALLQQAAVALLGSKSSGTSGGLAQSFGLDELSYRSGSSNADGSTSAGAVTLGKRFSRNFYAAYERSVSGAVGTLFLFYDLSQRFTLRAQAGQQSAVDLIFTLPFD
jgi:translocation and assembly module TamB